MRILILGHPRSGTGYTASCFRAAGWEVGHEIIGRDGIASWMWAVNSDEVPWGDARRNAACPGIVLHVLRDPAECLCSVACTESDSEKWRMKWISIPKGLHLLERSVWSMHAWGALIRGNNPTHTCQLESVEETVVRITGNEIDPEYPTIRNDRFHSRASADEIKATAWKHPDTARLWDQITSDYYEAA